MENENKAECLLIEIKNILNIDTLFSNNNNEYIDDLTKIALKNRKIKELIDEYFKE